LFVFIVIHTVYGIGDACHQLCRDLVLFDNPFCLFVLVYFVVGLGSVVDDLFHFESEEKLISHDLILDAELLLEISCARVLEYAKSFDTQLLLLTQYLQSQLLAQLLL